MLSSYWLRAFAPVGRREGDNAWVAFGAGVFFHRPPLLWLVTANHVVDQVGPHRLSVVVPRTAGGIVEVAVGPTLLAHGQNWVRDPDSDLACAPVPGSPEFALQAVTEAVCLRFADILPSMPCFTIGCPYGLHGVDPTQATPLVLDGVIAGVDTQSRRLFTSAPMFPGNSGGPLIAVRTPFSPDGTLVVGRPTVLLAGIMLQTVMVPSPGSPPTSPPLHLGAAAPIDAVLGLLDSDPARRLAQALAPGST